MGISHKTYHRRIFGGLAAQWTGLDQGKAFLYRGTGVRACINIDFKYGTIMTRDGQEKTGESYDAGILQVSVNHKYRSLAEGTRFWLKRKIS